jgi:hypothetical protein
MNAGKLTAPPRFPTGALPSNTSTNILRSGTNSPRSNTVYPIIQLSIKTDPSRPNLRPQENQISYKGI